MENPNTENKVITLKTLGTAIDKIEKDYMKTEDAESMISTEITKQLQESGSGEYVLATDDEVLALFAGNGDAGEEPEEEIDGGGAGEKPAGE